MGLLGKQLLHALANVSQPPRLGTFPGHRAHSLWQCMSPTAAGITVPPRSLTVLELAHSHHCDRATSHNSLRLGTFPGHRAHSLWQCMSPTAAGITVPPRSLAVLELAHSHHCDRATSHNSLRHLESSLNTILWRGEPLNVALAIHASVLISSEAPAVCVLSPELSGRLLQNLACLKSIHFFLRHFGTLNTW